MALSDWIDALASLCFPNACLYCSEPVWEQKPVLCDSCKAAIQHVPKPYYQIYREKIDTCFIDKVLIAFVYGPIIQELMEKLKYEGQKEIGYHLGHLAQSHLKKQIPDNSLIVPVPLHPRKVKVRGYNQARIIAEGITNDEQILIGEILERKRETPTQTKLNRAERIKNVSGAFAIKNQRLIEKNKDKSIIIVDDVMTSGATINEAALTLKKSGIREVIALGVASPIVRDFY